MGENGVGSLLSSNMQRSIAHDVLVTTFLHPFWFDEAFLTRVFLNVKIISHSTEFYKRLIPDLEMILKYYLL